MTNTKKTLSIVGGLVLLLVIIFAGAKWSKDRVDDVGKNDNRSSISERLESASLIMPDTKQSVTLADGYYESPMVEGAGKTSVTLGSEGAVKEFSKDGASRTDVLSTFDISFNGSEAYQYLGLYEDKDGQLLMKSIALIGGGVVVTDVTTDDVTDETGREEYLVTVSYLERASSDPSTEPTIAKRKYFLVEGGVFNLSKTDSAVVEEGKD